MEPRIGKILHRLSQVIMPVAIITRMKPTSHRGEDAHFLLLFAKISVLTKEMRSRQPPVIALTINSWAENIKLDEI